MLLSQKVEAPTDWYPASIRSILLKLTESFCYPCESRDPGAYLYSGRD